MLRDLSLAAKSACSKEDQELLVPIVKQLKELRTDQEDHYPGRIAADSGRRHPTQRVDLHQNISRQS